MKKTIIPYPGWSIFSISTLFIMLVLFVYELHGLYLELFVYSQFHSAISTLIITIETLVFLGLFALIILCCLIMLKVSARPIRLSQYGLRYGLIKNELYSWDEVSQWGTAGLFAECKGGGKSIYILFDCSEEHLPSIIDVRRLGFFEYWMNSGIENRGLWQLLKFRLKIDRHLEKELRLAEDEKMRIKIERILSGNSLRLEQRLFPKNVVGFKFSAKRYSFVSSLINQL